MTDAHDRERIPFLDLEPELERHADELPEAAARYDRLLGDVADVTTPEVTGCHVFHQYTIRVGRVRRGELRGALNARGIDTSVYYPDPCHAPPVIRERDFSARPVSEEAAEQVVGLPISSGMDVASQEGVAGAVRDVLME